MANAKNGAQFLVIDGLRELRNSVGSRKIKDIYNVAERQHIAIFDKKVFICPRYNILSGTIGCSCRGTL
jgi:hypothetical protein